MQRQYESAFWDTVVRTNHSSAEKPWKNWCAIAPPRETEPTLPVAPQQASLASSIRTFCTFPRAPLSPSSWPSWSRRQAAKAPTMPLPIITTSTTGGRSLVVRWLRSIFDGSLCQYDAVDAGVGRGAQLSCSVCVMVSAFWSLVSEECYWEMLMMLISDAHTSTGLVWFLSKDVCTVAAGRFLGRISALTTSVKLTSLAGSPRDVIVERRV